MISAKARAAVRLAWDVLVVLLTDRDALTCGQKIGPLTCERRENHGGMHAMLTRRVSGIWGHR